MANGRFDLAKLKKAVPEVIWKASRELLNGVAAKEVKGAAFLERSGIGDQQCLRCRHFGRGDLKRRLARPYNIAVALSSCARTSETETISIEEAAPRGIFQQPAT